VDHFEFAARGGRALGVKLVKREWLFQQAIWPARKYGWAIVGFNV
jgi:hypothetical protein